MKNQMTKSRKTLRAIAKDVKTISDRHHTSLSNLPDKLNDEQVIELVVSSIIRQMAETGLSVVLLTEPQHYYPLPAAALCRQIFEGYVYLNFIFADDSTWRAKEFLAQDLLWRESFNERNKGQDWHRRYETQKIKMTGIFSAELDTNIEKECANFEKEWLFHSIRHINSFLEEKSRLDYAKIADSPLLEIRQEWNSWKTCLPDLASKEWKLLTKRWDYMDRWPFGLSPSRILADFGLPEFLPDEESLPGMTQSELTTVLKQKEDVEQQSYWVGWELFSNYTHFSPTLLSPLSNDSVSIFLVHVSVFLLSALSFTNNRFNWISEDKIANLRNQLKHGSSI